MFHLDFPRTGVRISAPQSRGEDREMCQFCRRPLPLPQRDSHDFLVDRYPRHRPLHGMCASRAHLCTSATSGVLHPASPGELPGDSTFPPPTWHLSICNNVALTAHAAALGSILGAAIIVESWIQRLDFISDHRPPTVTACPSSSRSSSTSPPLQAARHHHRGSCQTPSNAR